MRSYIMCLCLPVMCLGAHVAACLSYLRALWAMGYGAFLGDVARLQIRNILNGCDVLCLVWCKPACAASCAYDCARGQCMRIELMSARARLHYWYARLVQIPKRELHHVRGSRSILRPQVSHFPVRARVSGRAEAVGPVHGACFRPNRGADI